MKYFHIHLIFEIMIPRTTKSDILSDPSLGKNIYKSTKTDTFEQ